MTDPVTEAVTAAPLWTPEALTRATGGALLGPAPAPVTGASIDTRTLVPGDLFFAIRGEARDGHDFVAAALARGAAAAVVRADRAEALAAHGPVLAVPAAAAGPDGDAVLAAMRGLARAARARTGASVVAVTGSVGKTGTKEALRHVLAAQGAVHASAASYNNHWGVPLTLARMPEDARYGVFEVGMNHAHEILPLTALVAPDVALVTTVEPVHIEHFPSLHAIADAKGEIFAGLKPGGVAVINRDNPAHDRLRAHARASRAGRVVTFGAHPEADVRALDIVVRPDRSVVAARVLGRSLTFTVGTAGRHVAMNALGVMAVIHALGADLAAAGAALAALRPPPGRGERTLLRIGTGAGVLVDESYNANPASVRAALGTLAGLAAGRRVAVLGDMLELGPAALDHHRGLAQAVAESGCDRVFTAGPMMRALAEALPADRRGGAADTADALVAPLLDALRPGDAVMVKGSNSMRMARIVAAIKARYADPAASADAAP